MSKCRVATMACSHSPPGRSEYRRPAACHRGDRARGQHHLQGEWRSATSPTMSRPPAKAKFTCSATTGDYTLTIPSVNIVDYTGSSFIAEGLNTTNALIVEFDGDQDIDVPMTQNTTNGLFQVDTTGTMYAPFCGSGESVEVFDTLTVGMKFLFYATLR